MTKQGQIKVDSENIFPIIKKWLYSDKDIFLRELVSNACDAISKLSRLNIMGETDIQVKGRIDIIINKDAKTLTVSDNGLGMTSDEVENYITKIAFSGATDFIEKYKDKGGEDAGIIGHFGLGFYSAFMVSNSVEIDTLSYIPDAKPVLWSSNGEAEYEITNGNRKTHGSTIILHISDDSYEFLEESKIRQMLKKYCQFMPFEIYLSSVADNDDNKNSEEKNETPINNTNPLWLKAPKDCTKEEYEKFYSEVFMDFNPPLFWIHLNVDYPFNLKGILYFPQQSNKIQVMPGEIKLYNNQVYIADNIKEVVPEFLMLLKGVIDCPDLPLNVSRSFLQNDGDVAKISRHITKKVSDKLHSIFKDDRNQFESYWDDISPFIKFGCIKDEKFYDRVKDIILFKTLNGNFETLEEFKENNKNKIFYVTDENVQAQYIKMFKDNNLNAVVLNHAIDSHFISFLEYKDHDIKFLRIDSDVADNMKSNDVNISEDEKNKIINEFKNAIEINDIEIKAENLKSEKTPAIILVSEYERRMNEMGSMYGDMFKGAKAKETMILNLSNSMIKNVSNLGDEDKKLFCKQIYDLAKISNKQLSSDEMSEFMQRSISILKKAFNN